MREGCPLTKEFTAPPAELPVNPRQERLAGGTPVFISDAHRFGADALLLADFSLPRRRETACDLGSGCGIIPLRWHDLGHSQTAVGVELSAAGSALLEQSAAQCGARIIPVTLDLRKISPPDCPPELAALLPAGGFDVVSCNPPYFTGGFVSQKPGRAAARHTVCCDITDVARAGAYLLKNGGDLCLCNRPDQLAEVIGAVKACGLEPKRLQFVKARPERAPWLFLLRCRKQGAAGLQVLPDFVSCDEAGGNSAALQAVYQKRKETP